MANPITGPFVTGTYSGIHTTDLQVKYKQARPFNQPLPYTRQVYTGSREDWSNVYKSAPDGGTYIDVIHVGPIKDVTWGPQSMPGYGTYRDHTTNRAYEKLKGKVSNSAGWAETIAQASSARDMFNLRANQVWSIVRFLGGRGKPPASLVNGPMSQKDLNAIQKAKKPSSTFLEVEYGWRPLISDIASSIQIMCSDPGAQVHSASASSSWQDLVTSYTGDGYGTYTRFVEKVRCDLRVRMGAEFVVSNPNLFLASRLGLIDPALPWKLIPYSFVVDWFINVEQVASSISDWFGLSVSKPYTTVTAKAFREENHASANKSLIVSGFDTSNGYVENVGVEVNRTLGLTGPVLTVKPFRGFSIERGLQAIALVITGLGGVSIRK